MQAQGIAALAPGQAVPMQNPMAQNNMPAAPNPGIPPDLKQLLSQQARNEMEQAAQRYQALQQALRLGQGTGKPPTIAQQVAMQSQRDMASKAGPAMQVQDQQKKAGLQALAEGQQGQADNPPQPESQGIAELDVPEMGKAGGGIIAFAKRGSVTGDIPELESGDYSSLPDETEAKPEDYVNWWEKVGPALRSLVRQAANPRGDVAPAPQPGDSAMNALAAARVARQEGTPALPESLAGADGAGGAGAGGAGAGGAGAGGAGAGGAGAGGAGAGGRNVIPTTPRMPVVQPTNSAFGDTGYLGSLPQAVQKSLLTALGGTSEDAENKAAQEVQNAGLADLLKAQRDRAAALQARQQAAVDQRVPAWAMGAMGATQPRGAGLGSLLASWGAGANKAQQGYTAEDLANAAQLDKLNNDIDVAKYQGNMEVVKAKQEARKEFMGNLTKTQASAVQLIDAAKRSEDAANARIQEAQLRHMDLAQRVKESGDMKLLQQIEFAKRAADANATRQAETEEKGKSATGDINPLVVQAKAAQYAQAALDKDPVYQRAMKQYMGADYVVPKPIAADDSAAKLQAAAAEELARRKK